LLKAMLTRYDIVIQSVGGGGGNAGIN